jgi:hypothetical protein
MDAQTVRFDGLFTVEDTLDVEPCEAQSIGFLVRETKEAYYMAPEMWPEANIEGRAKFKYLHIVPKLYVRKVRFLK